MNILITGATRGIGKAIADACIATGNQVFAVGRNEELLKIYKNYFYVKITVSAIEVGESVNETKQKIKRNVGK